MYTGGFYIRKTDLLNESKEFYLGKDIRGYLLPSKEVLDIDTEEDKHYFEFLIYQRETSGYLFLIFPMITTHIRDRIRIAFFLCCQHDNLR